MLQAEIGWRRRQRMKGIWILGDQLMVEHPALVALERTLGRQEARRRCRLLLIESRSVLARRRYHRQKLVLVWSAMRHYAAELASAGWLVDHLEAESFADALPDWIGTHGITALEVMEPAERPFRQAIERLSLPIPLHWHPSTAFLWSREAFGAWARPYRQLRMELFYREGRRRFGVLMDPAADPPGSQPLGGQWNYDHANRRAPRRAWPVLSRCGSLRMASPER